MSDPDGGGSLPSHRQNFIPVTFVVFPVNPSIR
jgi:hypothetical protein